MIKHFRTIFSHILPLEYDLSLSPYEIIDKILWYVDQLADTTNANAQDIAEIKQKIKELEGKGFTDEQLKEVLEEMIQDGEFDFLMALFDGSTIFNQIVGIEPYAQMIPEVLQANNHFGVNTAMTAVGFAIAEISGIPYAQMCFCNSGYTESELVTFNITTGDVIAHRANTAHTHVGDVAYNPKDGMFYYSGGTERKNGYTFVSVFNINCEHVRDIIAFTDSRIGHMCFLPDGTTYLINMPTADESSQELIVYDDITNITEFNSDEAISHIIYRVDYSLPSNHQRQGMFTDGEFIYVLRGHNGADYPINNRYQVIDIFSIDNQIPSYYQTVTLDAEMEMEGGDYWNGTYYLNFGSVRSGFICKASIKAKDLKLNNNRAYSYLANLRRPVKLGSTEGNIYVSTAEENHNYYFVDGSESKPYYRLETAVRMLPNKPTDGLIIHVAGDLTVNGFYTRTQFRCVTERLTIIGDGTAILPYQAAANCNNIKYDTVTINGNGDQAIQIYQVQHCALDNVEFVGDSTSNVLVIQASEVDLTNCSITGTFTNAINARAGARIKGRLAYDSNNTRIGEYSLVTAENIRDDGSYFTIANDGIDVYLHIRTTAQIAANGTIATLPNTYKQTWALDRLNLPVNPFIAASDTNRIYYDYSANAIKTAIIIPTDTSLVITGHIPITTVTI